MDNKHFYNDVFSEVDYNKYDGTIQTKRNYHNN